VLRSSDNHRSRLNRARKAGLVLALAGPLLLPAALNGLFHLDHEPHLCSLLAFAFVLHLWIRPGIREICADVGAASVFLLLYSWVYGIPNSPFGPVFTGLTYAGLLGLGSTAVLAVQAQRTTGDAQERRQNALAAGLIAPAGMILIGYPLQLSALLHPRTFDAFLYSFDLSLGFSPSFLIGQAFTHLAPLRIVSSMVYDTLPLVVSFFYAALMLQKKRFRVNVILLFTGALLIGSLLYNVCPATGPTYAFPGAFPNHPPLRGEFAVETRLVPGAPRNAMPSLHTSLALLVFWNAYVWGRKGRILAGLYLFFTLLATLGTGEHYLIDLVVALPFSLAMQALFTTGRPLQDPTRWRPLLLGSAVTALWFAVLRSPVTLFEQSAIWPWTAVLLVLAICWTGKRLLDSPPADLSIAPSQLRRSLGVIPPSSGS